MAATDIIEDFGQLFILAFDGASLHAEVAEFLRTFHIGGVILFGDNYRDPAQLGALAAEVQERCAPPDGTPLFIATDHEGGRVQRFVAGFTRLPPMATFGSGPPEATEAAHLEAARELAASGINFNLAPVADLCPPDRPGAIGDRAFGSDPALVARHVAAAVRGIRAAGLLACAKHFPGHGATEEDSHRVLPEIRQSRAAMEASDLVPFRAALEAGVDAVMTAHAVYPEAGDATWPASLSPHWLTGVLRGELGFQGLIVTDAIEMKGLAQRFGPLESGHRALGAGADILLYYKEAHQFNAFYELRRALERGEIDPGAVAASIARVRRAKAALVRSTAFS